MHGGRNPLESQIRRSKQLVPAGAERRAMKKIWFVTLAVAAAIAATPIAKATTFAFDFVN